MFYPRALFCAFLRSLALFCALLRSVSVAFMALLSHSCEAHNSLLCVCLHNYPTSLICNNGSHSSCCCCFKLLFFSCLGYAISMRILQLLSCTWYFSLIPSIRFELNYLLIIITCVTSAFFLNLEWILTKPNSFTSFVRSWLTNVKVLSVMDEPLLKTQSTYLGFILEQ